MEKIRNKQGFICDMDGVIYREDFLLEGTAEFVEWLQKENKKFLFLTNSSERTPLEFQQKLARLGINVDKENFYTSAQATASFLAKQCPKGSAYVIGEAGLINALYKVDFSMNNVNPDYVVVGETKDYSYEKIKRAVNLVRKGAKLIGTNPDVTDPIEKGIAPATGALIAPIEMVTRSKAYFVGKPNPLMMRHALAKLECRREDTVIIGDRMDTDIIAGLESGIDTILALSGVTSSEELVRFAYRPHYIINSIKEILL